MTSGRELIAQLLAGEEMERAPFVPILGAFARTMGQLTDADFRENAQRHSVALVQTAEALSLDAITVGPDCPPAIGLEVCRRLSPVLQDRGLAACIQGPDISAARAYCEEGVQMLFVVDVNESDARRFKTLRNVCNFYRAPVILADAGVDAVGLAQELKVDGAIVPAPSGDEPGIVGGGLGTAPGNIRRPDQSGRPRRSRFFWSFPGALPPECNPEELVELGKVLSSLTDRRQT